MEQPPQLGGLFAGGMPKLKKRGGGIDTGGKLDSLDLGLTLAKYIQRTATRHIHQIQSLQEAQHQSRQPWPPLNHQQVPLRDQGHIIEGSYQLLTHQ